MDGRHIFSNQTHPRQLYVPVQLVPSHVQIIHWALLISSAWLGYIKTPTGHLTVMTGRSINIICCLYLILLPRNLDTVHVGPIICWRAADLQPYCRSLRGGPSNFHSVFCLWLTRICQLYCPVLLEIVLDNTCLGIFLVVLHLGNIVANCFCCLLS